jgi:hypothetical protein
MSAVVDMTGKKFGHWTVLKRAGTSLGQAKQAIWLCKCDCGKLKTVYGSSLRQGQSTSCQSCAGIRITNKRFGAQNDTN